MSHRLKRLRTFAVAAMTFGLLAGTATVASATEEYTEDPRAEVHEGNVDQGMPDACSEAGLTGEVLTAGVDFTFSGGVANADQYLAVIEVTSGVTVTGIVVKGGDSYNVYEPGQRGLAADAPWEQLRSPLNGGGKIPQISHWFVCGEQAEESTTPPAEETKPTTPPETTTSDEVPPPADKPTSEAPQPSSSAPVATTTSQEAAPVTTSAGSTPVAEEETKPLAETGFSGAWLIGVAALLLAGGAALLLASRIRKSKA